MKIRNYFMYVLAICAAAAGITSCSNDDNPEINVEIKLNKELISLVVGTTETLTATVTPSDIALSNIAWSSDDTSVATVSGGMVTAVSPGRTVVYARIGDKSDKCDVVVTEEHVSVSSVSLNHATLKLGVGDVESLIVTIEPEEATDKTVSWSSSAPGIVSVHETTGEITAVAEGRAVITVTTNDGGLTAECEVTVGASIELETPADNEEITLYAGYRDAVVEFSWTCDIPEVTDFIFELGFDEELDEPAFSRNLSETELEIPHHELNEIVKAKGTDPVTLYWTVRPLENGDDAFTSVRSFTVTPDTNEYSTLDEGSATGMTLEKLTGNFRYSIQTNGPAKVRTTPLTAEAEYDYVKASLMYKSNRDLDVLKISLVNSEGTVLQTLQKELPEASGMTSLALYFTGIIDTWGGAGDYLEFDFGDNPGFEAELDALLFEEMSDAEFRKNYAPRLWLMKAVWNCQLLEGGAYGQSYVSLRVTENAQGAVDPSINLNAIWSKFHPDAVKLTFEYKADEDMRERMRLFIHGGHLTLAQNENQFMNITDDAPKAAADWTTYSIDISTLRERSGWGDYYAGWELRLDPGNVAGYEFHIRNIRLELK